MKEGQSLVKQLKKGDRIAFNALYKQHYLSLHTFAELFLDTDDAEDVVQDVFLNVWLHRERIDDAKSFKNYLLRSVYNTALNLLKQKNRQVGYEAAGEKEINALLAPYFDPDANEIIRRLFNEELHRELSDAIQSLPPKCREVFSMSYLHHTPSKEISQRLGISLRTVDNHIYAALKQLREQLRRHRNKFSGLFFFIMGIIAEGQ